MFLLSKPTLFGCPSSDSAGDRGASGVRGEDQRFDASRAPTGTGGHHHLSESSGEKWLFARYMSDTGRTRTNTLILKSSGFSFKHVKNVWWLMFWQNTVHWPYIPRSQISFYVFLKCHIFNNHKTSAALQVLTRCLMMTVSPFIAVLSFTGKVCWTAGGATAGCSGKTMQGHPAKKVEPCSVFTAMQHNTTYLCWITS